MTAGEMIKRAVNRLGYTESDDSAAGRLGVVNDVYAEIFYAESNANKKEKVFKPLTSLTDELNLSERALNDCMVYGLCEAFALSENDSDNQSYYAELYNQKFKMLPKRTATRQDVQPTPEGANC